jgi:hypothetical protein
LRFTSLHPNGLAGVRIRVRGAGAEGAGPDRLSPWGTGRACPLWVSDAHRGWAWNLCSPPCPCRFACFDSRFGSQLRSSSAFCAALGADLSFVLHIRSCVFNNILASIVLKYIYFAAPLPLLTCGEYRRAYSRRRANDSLSAAEFDNCYRLSKFETRVKRNLCSEIFAGHPADICRPFAVRRAGSTFELGYRQL